MPHRPPILGVPHEPGTEDLFAGNEEAQLKRILKELNLRIGFKEEVLSESAEAFRATRTRSGELTQEAVVEKEDYKADDLPEERFDMGDARRLVNEVVRDALNKAKENNLEVTALEYYRMRAIILDNLLRPRGTYKATIGLEEEVKLKDEDFTLVGLSALPDFIREAHWAIIDKNEEVDVLPTHPTYYMKLDAILTEMIEGGQISREMARYIAGGSGVTAEQDAEAKRRLVEIEAKIPEITLNALQNPKKGDYQETVASLVRAQTLEREIAGTALFPPDKSSAQLRAEGAAEGRIESIVANPTAFLNNELQRLGLVPELMPDKASRDFLSQFTARLTSKILQASDDLLGTESQQAAMALIATLEQDLAGFNAGLQQARLFEASEKARGVVTNFSTARSRVIEILQSQANILEGQLPSDFLDRAAFALLDEYQNAEQQGRMPQEARALAPFARAIPGALQQHEAAGVLSSPEALSGRITSALIQQGAFSPNAPLSFLANFQQNVLPRIASTVQLRAAQGVTPLTTDQIISAAAAQQGDFAGAEAGFAGQLGVPAGPAPPPPVIDIDQIISGVLEEQPAYDINEADFARQFGTLPPMDFGTARDTQGGLLTPPITGPTARFTRPLPPIGVASILPELRQGAGESADFLNFLRQPSVLQELQGRFQEARTPQVDLELLNTRQQGWMDQRDALDAQIAGFGRGTQIFSAAYPTVGEFRSDYQYDAPGVAQGLPPEALAAIKRRRNIGRILKAPERSLTPGATTPGQDFSEFFQGQLAGLRKRFSDTPAGMLEEQQAIAQQERDRAQAQRDAEMTRRRRLQRAPVVRV